MIDEPRALPAASFAEVVRNTPLVSIDLIVKNPNGRVLTGLRVNEPAKGTYFVPGGVVRKNERIRDAFKRIMLAELGMTCEIEQARFFGVFEHLYSTNRFGDPSYGTHYVVLAYEILLAEHPSLKHDDQHSAIQWMKPTDILSSPDVHPNTKTYFM